MPDESNMVPFGPCLSPGMLGAELEAAPIFREKLALRGLLAAITITQSISTQLQQHETDFSLTEPSELQKQKRVRHFFEYILCIKAAESVSIKK